MKVTQKLVQVGRVCFVAFGPEQGKLCTIVDIVDINRALVDGPTTGVRRQVVNVKSLHLTKFRVRIPHSAREKTLKKALVKAEFEKKWAESSWAKKLVRAQVKANLTDFERFKLMRAKQARNNIIRLEVGKLRLKAKKSATSAKKETKKVAKPAPKKK